MNEVFFRMVGMGALGVVGWKLGDFIARQAPASEGMPWILSLGFGGAVLGLLVTPYLARPPLRWATRRLSKISSQAFFAALAGLVIGLISSAFLALPLSLLPGLYGKILPPVFALLLSYLAISIMVMRSRELFQLFSLPASRVGRIASRLAAGNGQVLVDTSAIIDGRIADISQAGFLSGPLIIPKFVLDELQHIADSTDSMRRKRGRRGLEMLNKLQKESEVPVQIDDVDFVDVEGVDSKLVKLARTLHCPIITNDFNLNRVAELQGVPVLNVNELAAAVRPVVLPGEEMEIRIIQEGREPGQGVGFLDDGTMVVVDGGRKHLNNQVDVVITRVLQTATGRMIFAQLKEGASHERGDRG